MKKILLSLILIVMTLIVYSADFYLLSNKYNGTVSLFDRLEDGILNVEVKPGELISVIEKTDTHMLLSTIEGEAGWAKLTQLEFLNSFIPVYDDKLKSYYTDEKDIILPVTERASILRVESPLIIKVSLKGLLMTVSCPPENFERVYPVGVGVLGSNGKSITPTHASQNKPHFNTWHDSKDTWYYMARRNNPAYFAGQPFIRLTIENTKKQHTYGMHGPTTQNDAGEWFLKRGFVSSGCFRMRPQDVIELFPITKKYPNAKVYVQEDYLYDNNGKKIDVDYPVWR